ncbi:hypothetical protein AU255_18945 [Methyloprofundus sedimenti]|uniref:RRM domain-containing protein n=1 Tax=Methyloprofundus sedimenti TaxID=1420851 RepID=A0A1V8M101_9GAMM|nr:RNA-binding protein [Methyloprofundus sedimenti]OQK15237.1 hypothetical protein AU255_18945 [Methyloprofundus sedimenti]
MHVFFRNIPAESRRSDLINVIEPVLKRVWFRRNGIIVKVKIIHQQEHGSNHSVFHGLVTIEPDAVAEKVIKRLNRKMFLGRHIAVREYHHRVWHNDPRVKHNSHDPEILNRREGDRRRKNLIVVNDIEATHNFSGDKAFHRQYK